MKRMTRLLNAPLILVLVFTLSKVVGQEAASYPTTGDKNIIKFDLSTWIVWGAGNYVLSYERQLNRNRAFMISVGSRRFPQLLASAESDSSFLFRDHTPKFGYSVMLNYKSYFINRNKFGPPDGLYWGPFVKYYNTRFENTVGIRDSNGTDQSVSLDTRLSTTEMGLVFGYQMILGDKWAIEGVFFGPSVVFYNLKVDLEGNFTLPDNEIFDRLKNRFTDRFPIFSSLLEEATFESNGTLDKFWLGWNYKVSVGYRF